MTFFIFILIYKNDNLSVFGVFILPLLLLSVAADLNEQ